MNTATGWTQTSEGGIPHVRHPSDKFDMPVKLDFSARNKGGRRPPVLPPLREDGKLVYALPGGGSMVVANKKRSGAK